MVNESDNVDNDGDGQNSGNQFGKQLFRNTNDSDHESEFEAEGDEREAYNDESDDGDGDGSSVEDEGDDDKRGSKVSGLSRGEEAEAEERKNFNVEDTYYGEEEEDEPVMTRSNKSRPRYVVREQRNVQNKPNKVLSAKVTQQKPGENIRKGDGAEKRKRR